ncbi:serine hydrolase domain-containing protein [Streptomyces pharetrae]|uniref:serine hydrolase domain-containing protein n=1 Tax=Streptomyces pharetrae TaxID=291370 RepID=UPI003460690F
MTTTAPQPVREVDPALTSRLENAVRAVDAPDVVFAYSHHGRRTLLTGGTAPPSPVPRQQLRYEIGSVSKTCTGLLLAHLISSGALSGNEPAAACLDPGAPRSPRPAMTLTHLITHTSGLPPLPADFSPQALPHWQTNPYAHYPPHRVIRAFLRHRPRHRPGTRWRYSDFAVAALDHTLTAATTTPWDNLLTRQVLTPLGLTGTALHPGPAGTDATGHRADGTTRVPALHIEGFAPADAVRATPDDLLTYLEAHLHPDRHGPLQGALHHVRHPVLRRGRGHAHAHTLTWFQHPTDHGPLYFHAGATTGQQAFLGFRPDTDTAVAALSTRHHRRSATLVASTYDLLFQPPPP